MPTRDFGECIPSHWSKRGNVKPLFMQSEVNKIVRATPPQVSWGITVMSDAETVISVNADSVLYTASLGKIFVLAAVAEGIESGRIHRHEVKVVDEADRVADSGLWQFMPDQTLSIESLAVLVGAVSDNLATNTLIRHVGLDVVQRLSADFEVPESLMLDRIRDARSELHPAAPSQGCRIDLAGVMRAISRGAFISPVVSRDVAHWLSLNTDLSMVAAAFDLDPLAHADRPSGKRFFNKTGTDRGVRADAGFYQVGHRKCAYAVIAQWDGVSVAASPVMDAMRRIGAVICAAVVGD